MADGRVRQIGGVVVGHRKHPRCLRKLSRVGSRRRRDRPIVVILMLFIARCLALGQWVGQDRPRPSGSSLVVCHSSKARCDAVLSQELYATALCHWAVDSVAPSPFEGASTNTLSISVAGQLVL
jgi:hypothetical protein